MSGTGARGVEELDFICLMLSQVKCFWGGTGYDGLKAGRKTAYDTEVGGFISNT